MASHTELRSIISDRVSHREYSDKQVSDEVVADILRLTQRAPTAFNSQPYVAVVLREQEDKDRLAPAMLATNQTKVKGAPLVIAFAADLQPSKNVPRLQDMMREAGAPEGMVNYMPTYLDSFSGENTEAGSIAWSYKQTSIAAATFLYAARIHGLVTCPMEGFDQEGVKKALGLSERYSVPIVISAGYAKDDAVARGSIRLPPTEVFFEGQFGKSTAALFAEK
ncbi:hypothetical protein ATCC90586_006227 [Pythium insidiosum]|nr:hypothetical protein ATCC90586_006227 [Pythium insidiosum]